MIQEYSPRYTWNTGIPLEYTWNTGRHMEYTWNTGIHVEHIWNTLGIQEYIRNTLGIHLEYTWNAGIHSEYTSWNTGIHLESTWNTFGIQGYAWNTGIHLEFTWNTFGIHLEYNTGMWISVKHCFSRFSLVLTEKGVFQMYSCRASQEGMLSRLWVGNAPGIQLESTPKAGVGTTRSLFESYLIALNGDMSGVAKALLNVSGTRLAGSPYPSSTVLQTEKVAMVNYVNTMEMTDSRSGSRGPYHWGGATGPGTGIIYIYTHIYIYTVYIYIYVYNGI